MNLPSLNHEKLCPVGAGLAQPESAVFLLGLLGASNLCRERAAAGGRSGAGWAEAVCGGLLLPRRCKRVVRVFYFYSSNTFIYLFWAMPGVCRCVGFSLAAEGRAYFLVAVWVFPLSPLVEEHRP